MDFTYSEMFKVEIVIYHMHNTVYSKSSMEENFCSFHGFLLNCKPIMALLLGNISLQKCYSENFIVNSHFPLKRKKFPTDVFPYTVI